MLMHPHDTNLRPFTGILRLSSPEPIVPTFPFESVNRSWIKRNFGRHSIQMFTDKAGPFVMGFQAEFTSIFAGFFETAKVIVSNQLALIFFRIGNLTDFCKCTGFLLPLIVPLVSFLWSLVFPEGYTGRPQPIGSALPVKFINLGGIIRYIRRFPTKLGISPVDETHPFVARLQAETPCIFTSFFEWPPVFLFFARHCPHVLKRFRTLKT